MRPVPISQVHVTDGFWLPKLKLYKEQTIPHSWDYLETVIEEINGLTAGQPNTAMQSDRWHESNLYKHLEAVSYALHEFPDEQLKQKLDAIIGQLAAAQRPDGYLYVYGLSRNLDTWTDLLMQHEDFCCGHLYEAAAFHSQLHDDAFLDIARKSADQAHRQFIQKQAVEGSCGHAGMELGLVELYRRTKDQNYLELAIELLERRGQGLNGWDNEAGEHSHGGTYYPTDYVQDHLPLEKQAKLRGHAVRAIYFLTGIVDVAIETGRPEYLAAAGRLWGNVCTRKMSITGGIGALARGETLGDDYELPKDSYNESCAACGMANCAAKMLRFEADAEHADVLERVLYNGVLHGIGLDGKSFYYENWLTGARRRGNPWTCCPPNTYRTLLGLGRYIYTQTDDEVFVNLYVGNTSQIELSDTRLAIEMRGDYAWEGVVEITPNPREEAEFAINLRIPAWCRRYDLLVNGEHPERVQIDRGFAKIRRTWNKTDTVRLQFDVEPQRVQVHPAAYTGQPWIKGYLEEVAVRRGPFIYAVEATDNGGETRFTLSQTPDLRSEPRPDMLAGIVAVRARAHDGKDIVMIPYYALANREPSETDVWLTQEGKTESAADCWDGCLYREYEAAAPMA